MISEFIVTVSPRVEQIAAAAVLTLGVVFLSLSLLRRPTGPGVLERWEASLTPSRERALLVLILAAAVLMRTVGWSLSLTPPFWFSEVTTLWLVKAPIEGTLWRHWIQSFRNYNVGWDYHSVVMLPVAAGVQWLLGPRFHLPVLAGAVWGVSAVALAWALGRTVHSRSFGLVFAAMVAVSPLQLMWSRLGGICIGCVPHVLLVMFLGYVAGKRGSPVLAVAAALATWATLYQYYAARVAMPLGVAALWGGLRAARRTLQRNALVLALFALTLGAIYLLAHPSSLRATLWPQYGGYVGNKGERTLGQLVTENAAEVRGQVRLVLCRYFLVSRADGDFSCWPGPGGGMRSGGLSLAPIGLLGVVGLGWSVWRLRSQWLWLLLAALGFAVPALSVTTARRLLILDLGWCALAAFGLLAVVRSRLCRGIPPAVTSWLVSGSIILIGTWSFASVLGLSAILGEGAGQSIPYGESGFGDGMTCLRCLHAANEWQREIEEGRFVVLFDTDLQRENATSPGGLPVYGKLAALAAGRPASFLQFYPAMSNFEWGPPEHGPLFDSRSTDFASYVIDQISAAQPTAVVWHFERPTQWEEWLADRLGAAGGEMRQFATPLSPKSGIQVRTDWSRRDGVIEILRGLASEPGDAGRGCLALEELGTRGYPLRALHIAGAQDSGPDRLPEWLVSGDSTSQYKTFVLPDDQTPIGVRVDVPGGTGTTYVHAISRWGRYRIYELPSGQYTDRSIVFPSVQGLDCAARVGSHWWVVDPTTGTLFTTDQERSWVPAGRWVGIARGPGDQLVLASAEQELVIFDLASRTQVRRFPAVVWPSRRVSVGECSQVVAGGSWYGTFNHMTSLLTVYDREGRRVGSRHLDEFLRAGVTAVAAEGGYLAVGVDGGAVKTVAVKLEGCE